MPERIPLRYGQGRLLCGWSATAARSEVGDHRALVITKRGSQDNNASQRTVGQGETEG
jgi:hypothetical protein